MIDTKLRNYVEGEIIPRYLEFDKAHSVEHVTQVISTSLEIASTQDVSVEMVYVIAAFHDLGIAIDRKNHHIESAKILLADAFICGYFCDSNLNVIAEAIEDHRASGRKPRSIYGMIVSDADKDYDFDNILVRCVNYRLDLDFYESFSEVKKHVYDKYRTGGYLKDFYIMEKSKEVQIKFDLFLVDDEFALTNFKRIYGKIVFGMGIIGGYDESSAKTNKITRDAVRAIIVNDDKILMIHSQNAGDYKFPGGGIDYGENHIEALLRELKEEAGVIEAEGIKAYGCYVQKHDSVFEDSIFLQHSYYYTVAKCKQGQFDNSLMDQYERDLDMRPVWVSVDVAIEANKNALEDENANFWVRRELEVLKMLKESIF